MKVKMLEVFQGKDVKGRLVHDGIEVSIFQVGDELEVSQSLGEWLVEHRKAEKIESAYVKPVSELPESEIDPEPIMKTKRGRNAKG